MTVDKNAESEKTSVKINTHKMPTSRSDGLKFYAQARRLENGTTKIALA